MASVEVTPETQLYSRTWLDEVLLYLQSQSVQDKQTKTTDSS